MRASAFDQWRGAVIGASANGGGPFPDHVTALFFNRMMDCTLVAVAALLGRRPMSYRFASPCSSVCVCVCVCVLPRDRFTEFLPGFNRAECITR